MRFRERFGALIRKDLGAARVKKEKDIAFSASRLHLLLSTFALGQYCRHLADMSSTVFCP